MFTNEMIESRLDLELHTIMVRVDGEWLDVRFVDGHCGLKDAAWVIHNHAMTRHALLGTEWMFSKGRISKIGKD